MVVAIIARHCTTSYYYYRNNFHEYILLISQNLTNNLFTVYITLFSQFRVNVFPYYILQETDINILLILVITTIKDDDD